MERKTESRQSEWREIEEGEKIKVFHFSLRSTELGSMVFIGAKDKVHLRNESYAWAPKSWNFVKLHEVGNFPTLIIFSLKAI